MRELRLDVLAHLDGTLVEKRLAVVEEVDSTSDGPASSTTGVKRSKSSMPACRVRVMPVSGAQQAWKHEMLQAAVHSMYRRLGSGPAVERSRRGGGLVRLQRQLQRAVAAERSSRRC